MAEEAELLCCCNAPRAFCLEWTPLDRLKELRGRVDAGELLSDRENDELRLLEAAVSSAASEVLAGEEEPPG